MKALFVVAVVLLVVIAGVGFYRGWFNVSTTSTDQKPSATITVDKGKIHADENTAREELQGFGQKVKENTSNLTDKAKH
jgi:hypothetical protein